MLLLDGEWREEGSAELDVEFELRDLSNLAQRPTTCKTTSCGIGP